MDEPRAPLLVEPFLAARPWGGTRLGDGIGEAWDLSVHPHGRSRVHGGPVLADLVDAHPAAFGGPIDLLAKRLDCAETLSVQVHPKTGDAKTEAWVVLDAANGAGIYHGFQRPQAKDEVRRAVRGGWIPDLLRFVPLRPGQVVFVPAGTVHAIGAGLFLFELQQSADTTYRLFDWGRGREEHLEQALDCADLDARDAVVEPRPLGDGRERLVECEHFAIDRFKTDSPFEISPGARWTALLAVEGGGTLGNVALAPGETVVVPQSAGACALVPDGPSVFLAYGPA